MPGFNEPKICMDPPLTLTRTMLLKGRSTRTKYSEAIKASKKSWSIDYVNTTGDQFRLKQATERTTEGIIKLGGGGGGGGSGSGGGGAGGRFQYFFMLTIKL